MLKTIILGLINRVFGLKITENQLDAFIEFVKMLIGLFGGNKQEAANYCVRQMQLVKRIDDPIRAKAIFLAHEQTLQKVVQE